MQRSDCRVASRPASAVFNDPYLLPMILLHASTKRIWLARNVCHAWSETISSSARLQQKLFLKPTMDLADIDIEPLPDLHATRTCGCAQRYPGEDEGCRLLTMRFTAGAEFVVNPLVMRRPGFLNRQCMTLRAGFDDTRSLRPFGPMLLCQPPVTSATLALTDPKDVNDAYNSWMSRRGQDILPFLRCEVRNPGGVRVEDLCGALLAAVERDMVAEHDSDHVVPLSARGMSLSRDAENVSIPGLLRVVLDPSTSCSEGAISSYQQPARETPVYAAVFMSAMGDFDHHYLGRQTISY